MEMNIGAWFEIYVDDMDKAKRFYESVLDISMDEMEIPSETNEMNEFRMVSFPYVADAPHASGALVKAEGMKAGGNSTLIYFNCNDCSMEENRIAGAGGKVLKPKFAIGPHGFCSIGTDSEGNMFGLYSNQ